MATVYFSSGLARYTGGIDSLEIDARRVQDLIQAVLVQFPQLAEPIELMSIAVDGEIHQHADYVALSAASEVHLVPRIAGG